MWSGGVRIIVFDEKNRILMVKQRHPEREVWMLPGGGIEEGESASEAAIREVREETGIEINLKGLLWHVEEVSERGQRFVNFFLAEKSGGEAVKGSDPEFSEDEQVIDEVMFMTREDVVHIQNLYPEFMRSRFWKMLDEGKLEYDAFMMRE